MTDNQPNTTDNSLEWFAENLPPEYLNHPEYFLYSTALDVQQMQDIPENRRRFKKLLVERQIGEGIELPEIDQKQLHDFMNPNDRELKLQRSEELLKLTTRHLEQTQDFVQAQRLAVLELFHREAPFRQAEMDESYFRNRELVEADLRAFLEHAEGDSIKCLNTENPKRNVSIKTQSGEPVKWRSYLCYASGVLFDTRQRTDSPHRSPDALKALLRIAGVDIPEYIPMDKEYFSNPDFVKADLTAYLQHAKGDSLKDLHTQNPKPSVVMETQSGEKDVTWQAYLNRASGVLFGTQCHQKGKKCDNPHRFSDALKVLLKIAGAEIPEYLPMDEKYFNNPDYVKADLTAYLQHAKGDSLKDLHTRNPKLSVPPILTQSGEPVKWKTYLNRASGVLLGTKTGKTAKKSKNLPRLADALKVLLRIAGIELREYIPMDKEYFNNPEIVKADFNVYLQCAKGDSIENLSTYNPKPSVFIETQSGERVTWCAYLRRASGILFGTKATQAGKKSDNPHRSSDALMRLKQIATQASACETRNSKPEARNNKPKP